ncbi:hypothetical protein [Quatrionicoccus australiensis]|uniref:hypothetical protein n=1 Tax=Quatrionicoccus australiensis TaxID=138118 RepID=UPI001CFB6FCB|nr:hypothetical protein [Quatrionicoccus australiensis]MCB4359562.1 hypothetical protein [Quatrionicoccus australiensis]
MSIKTEIHQLQCKLTPTPSRWKLVRPDGTTKISKFFLSLLKEVRTTLEPEDVLNPLGLLLGAHTYDHAEALFRGDVPSLQCSEIDELAVRDIELFADGKLVVRSLSAADNPLNPRHSLPDALDMIDALADKGPDEKVFLRTLGQFAGQLIKSGDLDDFNGGGPHLADVQAYLASQ